LEKKWKNMENGKKNEKEKKTNMREWKKNKNTKKILKKTCEEKLQYFSHKF
jgi:hypothetical protein